MNNKENNNTLNSNQNTQNSTPNISLKPENQGEIDALDAVNISSLNGQTIEQMPTKNTQAPVKPTILETSIINNNNVDSGLNLSADNNQTLQNSVNANPIIESMSNSDISVQEQSNNNQDLVPPIIEAMPVNNENILNDIGAKVEKQNTEILEEPVINNEQNQVVNMPVESLNPETPIENSISETIVESGTNTANSIPLDYNSQSNYNNTPTKNQELPVEPKADDQILDNQIPVVVNSINNNQISEQKISTPIIETIPESNINESQISEQLTTDNSKNNELNNQNNNTINSNDGLEANDEIFNAVPKPPIFDKESKEKKKGQSKILLMILIILLIGAIGFGIYYFLIVAKNKTFASGITTKELKLELGDELSTNIDDYANISGIDKKDCKLDTKEILMNKVGAYKFSVTCGNKVVEGTAKVDDTTKPELILNEITVLPNATLNVTDIVENCIDASMCIYKFNDEAAVNEALKTIGEHEIEINASDEYNNESIIKTKLIVSKNAPTKYITCTVSSTENIEELSASLTTSFRFGVDSNNNFFNSVKSSEFKFNSKDSYNSIKNNYNETSGIYNITGNATFNELNKIITLKSNKTLDDIKSELNINVANNISTIQMYLSMLGYTCE